MKGISRRSVLCTTLPATLLAFVLPGRGHAAQPHMRTALRALKTAQHELEEASPDKGGHRVKALEFVHQAIDEVERGMEFDRRH